MLIDLIVWAEINDGLHHNFHKLEKYASPNPMY